MDEQKTRSVVELLLGEGVPNVAKSLPTARYKVKRLSKAAGTDVVFTLRALPYGRVQEIQDPEGKETSMQILLAGVVEPSFQDPALCGKFGGVTPAETVKALLLPGEIEDVSRAIERLSGFRQQTIQEVKNG